MGFPAAGEPPIFSARFGLIVQPDLEALDMAVLITAWHQKSRMTKDVPISLINIEPRNPLQVIKVGEDARQKTPGGAGYGQGAVHILLDTLLTQPPGQKVVLVFG